MAAGLLAFFIALFASLVLVVPVRALALRVGMVDLPGPRKVHLKPIPLLGGLAMYAAVVIALFFAFNGPARAQIVGILIGATLVATVGILDDRGVLHHQIKLFVGMPLAAAILLVSGIRAQVFSVLLGGRGGDFLDAALTLVWVVGITASFSILDHMDGLCAGVAAMASVFFAVLAYLNGQTLVTTLAAAVLGAATGFLRWNFKPVKIFMGDGGAIGADPGRNDFRHHAGHDFPLAPRPLAFCHTRERPRSSPSFESWPWAPRRCPYPVFAGRDRWRRSRARELSFGTHGFPDCDHRRLHYFCRRCIP